MPPHSKWARCSRGHVIQKGLAVVSRRSAQSKTSGERSRLECGGMTPLWPFGGYDKTRRGQSQAQHTSPITGGGGLRPYPRLMSAIPPGSGKQTFWNHGIEFLVIGKISCTCTAASCTSVKKRPNHDPSGIEEVDVLKPRDKLPSYWKNFVLVHVPEKTS